MLTKETATELVNPNHPILLEDANTIRLHHALRHATSEWHSRLHRHPLMSVFLNDELTEQQYHRSLQVLCGFYRIVDAILQERLSYFFPLSATQYILPSRYAWLLADLAQYEEILQTQFQQNWEKTPSNDWLKHICSTPAELIGWLYVVEGSALGGKFLSQRVRQKLGHSPRVGTHFFDGMGALTATQWQSFWDFAGAHCRSDEIEVAVEGALKFFSMMHQQMDGAFEEVPLNA